MLVAMTVSRHSRRNGSFFRLWGRCLSRLRIPCNNLVVSEVFAAVAVEKLVEKLGTNEMTPHGMVNIFIEEKWIKASPAFNAELCQKPGNCSRLNGGRRICAATSTDLEWVVEE